ncbi:UNVERIFIED_CONTAM: hypothetical protein FKN15_029169 [Acipenser sinensis]
MCQDLYEPKQQLLADEQMPKVTLRHRGYTECRAQRMLRRRSIESSRHRGCQRTKAMGHHTDVRWVKRRGLEAPRSTENVEAPERRCAVLCSGFSCQVLIPWKWQANFQQ